MILKIKAIPNARENSIEGWENETLRIRVRGVPEKGRVNENLIAFLAERLHIPKSKISLLSGHTSRIKTLRLEGIEEDALRKKIF